MSNKEVSFHGFRDEKEIEDVFRRFDVNGDGKISVTELRELLHALGSDISTDEASLMMKAVDDDGDGYLDLKEFAEIGVSSNDNSEDLKEAFAMYDLDKNGLISARELHRVLKKLGEKVTLEDCCRIIRSVDADGDGNVNFAEFKKMMTQRH